MQHAAADGRLIRVRCLYCKRLEHFLAADLAKVYGGDIGTQHPPFPKCSKCGSGKLEYELITPTPGDAGSLVVRRPAGTRTTQLWASVKLGDSVPNLGDPLPRQPYYRR